ncbi:MAG: DUF4389 domain-containing protein [Chloroflexi bacterium]|nr:DUF4389 domain-containing protein [Chloroflexota bacterium]
MAEPQSEYPVQLHIDYPDRPRDRLSTVFRLILFIPIAFILFLVSGSIPFEVGGESIAIGSGGVLIFPLVLMILFRKKYPRWWFDWNVELLRFSTRTGAYVTLLRDEYPSTDEAQAVRLDVTYPDAQSELNQFLPLVKWLLALPHYIVLLFLILGELIVVIISWFVILFTGRYPKPLFNYVVGVTRWSLRVGAYMGLLVTDRYPPFRLSP